MPPVRCKPGTNYVMIRLLHSLGILALLATCAVSGLCARLWSRRADAELAIPAGPDIVRTLAEQGAHRVEAQERASPLVVQAEALAAYLTPPPPPPTKPPPAPRRPVQQAAAPAARPVQTVPKFVVRAVSYCETRPEKSVALIDESGSELAYWVHEGDRIGHVAVHEIKPGAVICLAGEGLCEMAVEHESDSTAVASTDRLGPSSGPRAAAATERPSVQSPQVLRRPARQNRRTVGSDRRRTTD